MTSVSPHSRHGIQAEWVAFKKYICEPYINNPERLAAIELWFDELYVRRNINRFKLSYRDIKNEETGLSFDAFSLKNQIFFSRDVAVLTLPYPRDRNDPANKSDRLIGVWLNDVGALDEDWKNTYQSGIEELKAAEERGPRKEKYIILNHSEIVLGEIQKRLNSQNLLADAANYGTTLAQMRISDAVPLASNPHRDIAFTYPDMAPGQAGEGPEEPEWNRFIIHTLCGAGTTFLIGTDEDIAITVPTGATSSHFAGVIHKEDGPKEFGALHQGTPSPHGRAILTPKNITSAPFRVGQSSPLRFRTRPIAALNIQK